MKLDEIYNWLRETNKDRLKRLWWWADLVRYENVGDDVHLRGLLEISNDCVRRCAYCGISAANTQLTRYRMTADEVLECARKAVEFGYGTVVVQAGEQPELTADWVAAIVHRIKTETPLAVTLSLGERSEEELALWRRAGADRYLLRFETSDRALFDRLHPPLPGKTSDRMAILETLHRQGYETGSGVMVGIPGQTYESLARSVDLFRTLDLDMIGIGPYLAHPGTPLGRNVERFNAPAGEQVPNTELMAYKVLALARIVCPRTNIPSTTALATLNDDAREQGLTRGANVIMPNVTPLTYRRLYEIYPAKACLSEEPDSFHEDLKQRIRSIGRSIGTGPGNSPNHASLASRECCP